MRYIIALIFFLCADSVLAAEAQKVTEAVPAEIFNWIMAGVAVIGAALTTAIVVLYRSKGTGLTSEQAKVLQKVHDDLLPLVLKLETEQAGRRADIERLMGSQKDVFVKGLELTGKLPPLMMELKSLLERVERFLRDQEE